MIPTLVAPKAKLIELPSAPIPGGTTESAKFDLMEGEVALDADEALPFWGVLTDAALPQAAIPLVAAGVPLPEPGPAVPVLAAIGAVSLPAQVGSVPSEPRGAPSLTIPTAQVVEALAALVLDPPEPAPPRSAEVQPGGAFADAAPDPRSALPMPGPTEGDASSLPAVEPANADGVAQKDAAMRPTAAVPSSYAMPSSSFLQPHSPSPPPDLGELDQEAGQPRTQPVQGAIEGALRFVMTWNADASANSVDKSPASPQPREPGRIGPDLPERVLERPALASKGESASQPEPAPPRQGHSAVTTVSVPPVLGAAAIPVAQEVLAQEVTLQSSDPMRIEADPVAPDFLLQPTERSIAPARAATAATAALPPSVPATVLGALLGPVPGGIEVALSPAELGQLRIELSPDGDGLRIVLSAERPETLELLRRHADQLAAEVIAAGFSGAEMSFGDWNGRDGQDAPDGAPSELARPQQPPIPGMPLGQMSYLPAHPGGLNLRL